MSVTAQMEADTADPVCRLTVTFTGRVQGVGFRYSTMDVARRLPVTGFVRNEYDGTVLLVAEGAKSKLEALMEGIYRSPVGRFIEQAHQRWSEPGGEFRRFQIRYG